MLVIEGVGKVGYPVLELDAEDLIFSEEDLEILISSCKEVYDD